MNNLKRQNIEFLKKKIEEQRKKLLEIVQLWYYYQNDVYQEIMFKYDNIFGELEDEIDNKVQTAKELEKKVDFLRMKLRRGEEMKATSYKFIDALISRQISRSAIRSPRSDSKAIKVRPAKDELKEVKDLRCDVNDNYEIPALYRNLVKKLHPDVAGEGNDNQKFWDNVQLAYRTRDVDSLRVLNLTLCNELDSEEQENKNLEIKLKTMLYEIEQNIRKQESKINNLKYQEPFNFKDKLDNKFWVARRKSLLQDKLVQIDRKIKQHNHLLTALSSNLGASQKESSNVAAV